MVDHADGIIALTLAEVQFRLASAVRLATVLGTQPLELPIKWSHGQHVVEYHEVGLRPDQAEVGADYLHRSATYLMAVAMRDAIQRAVPNAEASTDPDIKGAFEIARHIRNAFAHRPFQPTWKIERSCRGKTFKVRDIIEFDTADLNGIPFDWRHYGGPLALLRLSHFVRYEILKDTATRPEDRTLPTPDREIYQQGLVVLTKIDDPKNGDTTA